MCVCVFVTRIVIDKFKFFQVMLSIIFINNVYDDIEIQFICE